MEYQQINRNAIKSWFISRIIFSLIFSVIYGGLVYKILLPKFGHFLFVQYGLNILSIILLVYLSLNTFVFPIIEYKQWKYVIKHDVIELNYGIFIKTKIIVPISRIQHLDINQGPIYRLFGLVCLDINTAGDDHEIPALTVSEANFISERLKDIIEINHEGE